MKIAFFPPDRTKSRFSHTVMLIQGSFQKVHEIYIYIYMKKVCTDFEIFNSNFLKFFHLFKTHKEDGKGREMESSCQLARSSNGSVTAKTSLGM